MSSFNCTTTSTLLSTNEVVEAVKEDLPCRIRTTAFPYRRGGMAGEAVRDPLAAGTIVCTVILEAIEAVDGGALVVAAEEEDGL